MCATLAAIARRLALKRAALCFCVLSATRGFVDDPLTQRTRIELHSPDWRLRRVAFGEIQADKSPEVRRELIDLLAREEAVTLQAYREGIGSEYKFGEEYPEYTAQLTEVVADNFKRIHDQGALSVLLHAAYNPDSVYAKWLGTQGAALLPFTSEMLRSDHFPDRESAIAVVAHLLAAAQNRKVTLSERDVERARQQLLAASKHPDMNTRAAAVEYIGRVGRVSDLGWLESLSTSDPDRDGQSSKYIVREAALKAISEIRARAQQSR
jgi:hypothetical protein